MRKIQFLVLFCFFAICSFAQIPTKLSEIPIILPGDKSINKSLLRDFNETTMDYFQSSEGVEKLLGNLVISQKYNNNVLEVIQTLNYQDKSKEPMLKRIVTDGKSFMPISLQSFNSRDGILELNFFNKITGTHQ